MFGHKLMSKKDLENIAAMQQQYESMIAALNKKVKDLEAGIRSGREQIGFTTEDHAERAMEFLGHPEQNYAAALVIESRKRKARSNLEDRSDEYLEKAKDNELLAEIAIKRWIMEKGLGPTTPIGLRAAVRVWCYDEDIATAHEEATLYFDGVLAANSGKRINEGVRRLNRIYTEF